MKGQRGFWELLLEMAAEMGSRQRRIGGDSLTTDGDKKNRTASDDEKACASDETTPCKDAHGCRVLPVERCDGSTTCARVRLGANVEANEGPKSDEQPGRQKGRAVA